MVSQAAAMTRAASKQSYYTIRFLADRDRREDAYRAYAYFRWVDDWIDERGLSAPDRIAFVECQQQLLNDGYHDKTPSPIAAEETMLLDLIRDDRARDEPHSGIELYLRNMMAVMAFDARRKGRLISRQELDEYTCHLATAVTEAIYACIGHGRGTPQGRSRYLAVTAAHITHMLRDMVEDVAAGYYNIPREVIEARGFDPADVSSGGYRDWVKSRVDLARAYFQEGKDHLRHVQSRRCRIAARAYMARFEVVLDALERDGYRLKREYPERKQIAAGLKIGFSALRAVGF